MTRRNSHAAVLPFLSSLFMLVFLLTSSAAAAQESKEQDDASGALYNFDGDYGKEYLSFVRQMIPGYDEQLDMMGDILVAKFAEDAPIRILVIGPGHGEELIVMARALPTAQITAYESSEAMVQACRHRIEQEGLADRVTVIRKAFGATKTEETCSSSASSSKDGYDAVTLCNVLHLMPEAQQVVLLQAVAEQVKPGGILLLAGVSIPQDDYIHNMKNGNDPPSHLSMFQIANRRWQRLGVAPEKRIQIRKSIGTTLFQILAVPRMAQELAAYHMAPPRQVFQGLGMAMWFSEKKDDKAHS